MKTGIKTTEFWLSVVTQVLTLLVLTGVVAPGDQATLLGAATNGVTAIGTLIASAMVIVSYINSRTKLKSQPTTSEPGDPPMPSEPPFVIAPAPPQSA